jgi:hypothetical protein
MPIKAGTGHVPVGTGWYPTTADLVTCEQGSAIVHIKEWIETGYKQSIAREDSTWVRAKSGRRDRHPDQCPYATFLRVSKTVTQ